MEGDNTSVPAYDCLVVIDLEATCDEGNPAFSRENQEVIEFPWVVVDLHTGVVCDRKQLFVRPEWTKEVSTFCTEKTGITNDKLCDAPYLADALAQFDMYVRENFLAKGKTFCIVTDGDWDIKVCLLQEARRKGIKLAPYFLVYFDVKQEFLKAYPQARKPSLKQMVERLGIKFVGRPHSGLDDATNIASVVLKLLEYGHVFALPDLISEDYDPADDPSFVDYNALGGGKGPSIFSRLPEGSEEETTVVVIRGLPWSASEGEIEEFFGGAEGGVVQGGVHIINNKNGRPSGVGYVEFESQEFTKQALNKNNTYMGSRYIEVYLSDPQRMSAVLEGQGKISERNVGTGNGAHIVGTTGPNGPSEDIRPGDWRCPNCNDHQFASRNACRKCATTKPGLELPLSHPHGFTGYGQPVQQPFHHQPPFISPIHMGIGGQLGNGAVNVRPGDWHCPVCSDLNFASRKICRKCETPSPFNAVKGSSDKWGWGGQPKESRSAIEMRPGDWHCPGCQDLNFASRRVCRKCGISNPTFAGPQPVGRPRGRGSYRPGDWYCPTCNHLNFASREVCRQCGSQPVDADVEGAASDQFGWQ